MTYLGIDGIVLPRDPGDVGGEGGQGGVVTGRLVGGDGVTGGVDGDVGVIRVVGGGVAFHWGEIFLITQKYFQLKNRNIFGVDRKQLS